MKVPGEDWPTPGRQNGITCEVQCLKWPDLPAKVVLSWPSNDISKVSELLIWESLEKVLCSARIPRASLNGVSLLSKGI